MNRTRITRGNHPAETWLGKQGEEEGDRKNKIERERNKHANIANLIQPSRLLYQKKAGADRGHWVGRRPGSVQREERENRGERHKRSEEDRTHSDNPGVKKRRSGGEEVEMVVRRWTAQWIIQQRGL